VPKVKENFQFKIDEFVKNQKALVIVIPVKMEIQENHSRRGGSDGLGDFLRAHQN